MAKNLNQIAEFGINGIPMPAILLTIVTILIIVLEEQLLKDRIKNNIYIISKRIICFVIGIIGISIICIQPNRYDKFNIKNDNGDNYVYMGANAVFLMHLGDFYTDTPKNYNESEIAENYR